MLFPFLLLHLFGARFCGAPLTFIDSGSEAKNITQGDVSR